MNKYKPYTLREKDALQYLNIGRTKFRELIDAGRLPQPRALDTCRLWRTTELEEALDKLIGVANDNVAPIRNSWADVLEDNTSQSDEVK